MATDLQFNTANINSYDAIPTGIYPVISSVALDSIVINHQTSIVSDGIVQDSNGVFVTWNYPTADNLYVRIAVGYQFQLIQGSFSADEIQGPITPGPVVYEQIVNLNGNPDPLNYINLQNGALGRVDLPPSALRGNTNYTVRIRALLFSELGAGTIGEQYFKYTAWATSNFRINNVPSATNLRVNGLINPAKLPKSDGVNFSFSFQDTDGPAYLYRIQVGTTPGVGFAANIWDSGLIAAGPAIGNRDFTLPFNGAPLVTGVVYAWRVNVFDGLSDGGWTAATDTFSINSPPTVTSIKISGKEILFGNNPTVPDTGNGITWVFADLEGDTQRAYNLNVTQILSDPNQTGPQQFEILVSGNVFSTLSSIPLPALPDGGLIKVDLSVRDSVEFGAVFSGTFTVNARPEVLNLKIDGKVNPGNVTTTTPAFNWQFSDTTPGDTQKAFRIQVSLNDTFTSLLWDTGSVTSGAKTVVYGSTASPLVAPVPLSHGAYYFARVQLSDGISFSDYSGGFFAVNNAPNSPTLLTPSSGAYSGVIPVSWMEASPLDLDGDTVSYSLEITNHRSTNQGWEYLAGPFPSGTTGFALDVSNIVAGNDYGVRVIANDGFCDSNPALGTSPVTIGGLGFTILNHPPVSPKFLTPKLGDTVISALKVEWLESNPPDIDGDTVFYVLELTRNALATAVVFENVGVFNEGTTATFIDVSELPDGTAYQLRLTAFDDKGAAGQAVLSPRFSIVNTPAINDFGMAGDNLFVGTSDGRVFKAKESIWQVNENFASLEDLPAFEQFSRGNPQVFIGNGTMQVQSPAGSTFIFRIGSKQK